MRFPKPLGTSHVIGITAPSSGIEPRFRSRFELAKSYFENQGYKIQEGGALHGDHKHVSAPKAERVRDFLALWNNPEIAAIIPPWGGELLIELLPLIDFKKLTASEPKWLMGYSDTSTLLFAITLMCDIATSHGNNFMDMVPAQADLLTKHAHDALRLKVGQSFTQESSPQYQRKWGAIDKHPDVPYQIDTPTKWKTLDGATNVKIRGRLIGGCLDTIRCLIGTPYGDLPKFTKKYASDGVILYMENCEQKPCDLARALWHMRFAGWFEGVSGILLGRSAAPDATKPEALNYVEALESVLGDLRVPVIYDADFGHVPPQMTFVNGAVAEVSYRDGAAKVVQTLSE